MVCDRCIMTVEQVLKTLDIPFDRVGLGLVEMPQEASDEKGSELKTRLESLGFEMLEDESAKWVEAVKNAVVDLVFKQDEALKKMTVSAFIQEYVGRDYRSLSNLFSAKEGQTIEQYVIAQKIERVKELLSYNELNISQIADLLHYSSVAHLSNQFKKITGLTPSQYKSVGKRKPLDKV